MTITGDAVRLRHGHYGPPQEGTAAYTAPGKLILKALSWGPRHGYTVAEWIEHATGETLSVGEGTLYPALHRLERQRLIAAEWGLSDSNRQAKFYRLNAAGRQRLTLGTTTWQRFVEATGRALRAPAPLPT